MIKTSNTLPDAEGSQNNIQPIARDALDDRIDELEQRLAALTADESPSKSSNASFRTAREHTSPAAPSENALGKRKEQDSPMRPNPVQLPQRGGRCPSFTTAQWSSPSTQTHSHQASTRPSTGRSSTAPTSQLPSSSSSRHEHRAPPSTRPSASSSRRRAAGPNSQNASASSSRRSSFKLSRPANTQLIRPTRSHLRTNSTWPSPTIIPDGKQALQSLRAFSDFRAEVFSAMQAEAHLTSNSLPTLPHPTTAAETTAIDNDATSSSQNLSPEYSNHVPAANIDWTSPSTRRREYEKIDRARRGVRGLIRRVTPRFLRRKDGRGGFHDDGKGSDAGTVRRFRMDVGEGGEEGQGKGGSAGDRAVERRWWKVGGRKVGGKKGKGRGMGNGKGNSCAEEGIELSRLRSWR